MLRSPREIIAAVLIELSDALREKDGDRVQQGCTKVFEPDIYDPGSDLVTPQPDPKEAIASASNGTFAATAGIEEAGEERGDLIRDFKGREVANALHDRQTSPGDG